MWWVLGVIARIVRTGLRVVCEIPQLWWQGRTDEWMCKEGESLVVLLHGVGQRIIPWEYQKKRYLHHFRGAAIYAPFFLHNGKLNDYGLYPVAPIKEWIQRHPDGKVLLVGFSNGGRVAMMMESLLHPYNVRVITVGSPICSTKLIEMPLIKWLAARKQGRDFIDDLSKGFTPFETLVHKERYVHIASNADEMCWPPERCKIPGNEITILSNLVHPALMASDEVRSRIVVEYEKFVQTETKNKKY